MPVDLPSDLRQAARSRKCIIFVGSGLSSAAGYPSWAELLDTLVDEAKKVPNTVTEGLDKYVQAKDYLTLADFARIRLGRNQYANIRAISYDSSAGHGTVVDVLTELQKEAPYAVASPV